MTGFGKAVINDTELGITLTVEISTVNRKQLEISAYIPRECAFVEHDIRKVIKSKLLRGSVNFRSQMTYSSQCTAKKININKPVAAAYISEFTALKEEFNLQGAISINDLIQLPDVITNEGEAIDDEKLKRTFKDATLKALDQLIEVRLKEGEELKKDLNMRLNSLKKIVKNLTPLTAEIPKNLKDKLIIKLEEAGIPIDLDDHRVLKEIVIFSDKSDVTEEITRLNSHFALLDEVIEKKDEAIGRNMDFIVQEIFREINTLGNKAAGTQVSPYVVQFKTELEKMREQIQNIE
jgi:uncharacterized protein (TIGR00255 family)